MISSVSEAFSYFESFANFEKRTPDVSAYRLDRMNAMCAAFGNPEDATRTIHVAGSKGKGSTVQFMAGILLAAGYKVGIYASPHLSDYRERICVPNGFFEDETYISTANLIEDFVTRLSSTDNWKYGAPTTFELLTLSAFLIFQRESIEWAVIETGVGGRLDATNVIHPKACSITLLELEHTDILGDRLDLIASEKAGIYKPNAELFSVYQAPSATTVLNDKAREIGCVVRWIPAPQKVASSSYAFFANDVQFPPTNIKLPVLGDFQGENANLAVETIRRLWEIGQLSRVSNADDLIKSVQTGMSKAVLPGRLEAWELLSGKGVRVILDVSHTPASVYEAAKTFAPVKGDMLLFACVDGKRHAEMAAILAPLFSRVMVTTPGSFKASNPSQVVASFISLNNDSSLTLDPIEAWDQIMKYLRENSEARCLVCGSFYLAGIIRTLLSREGRLCVS